MKVLLVIFWLWRAFIVSDKIWAVLSSVCESHKLAWIWERCTSQQSSKYSTKEGRVTRRRQGGDLELSHGWVNVLTLKSWNINLESTSRILCKSNFVGWETARHVDSTALAHHAQWPWVGPQSSSCQTVSRCGVTTMDEIYHHRRSKKHQCQSRIKFLWVSYIIAARFVRYTVLNWRWSVNKVDLGKGVLLTMMNRNSVLSSNTSNVPRDRREKLHRQC